MLKGLSYEARSCGSHDGAVVSHLSPICPMCQLMQDVKDSRSHVERANRMMRRAIDVADILRQELSKRPEAKKLLDETFPGGRLFRDEEAVS